jgi:MarR family transcriptional regulator, transcriptional regulator for hemolysin
MVKPPPKSKGQRLEPLGRQLVFTAKAMREAFEATLVRAGGSLGSWMVMSAIAEVHGMTQAALATHAHLEGATITHHVDRLEKAGLVRRVLDPDDRRVRRLELTPAGVELHARMMTAVIQLQTVVMAGLRQDDREVMARCLDLIQANLEASGAPAPAAEGLT